LTETAPTDLALPSGFTARPVDPDPDAAALYELIAEASVAEYGTPDVTLHVVRESYNTPGFIPEHDSRLVLDAGGTPAALVEFYANGPEYVAPFVYLRVRPHLLDAGLAEALLAWAERRGRDAVSLAAADLRVALHTNVVAANPGFQAILERAGWMFERVFWTMEVDFDEELPSEPELPPGIRIRTAVPGQDEPAVHRLEADAFARHYGYLQLPYDEWLQSRTALNPYNPSLWFLAVDADRIVGMSLCLSEAWGRPGVGWVATLGVHPEWRGRGLGLALLRHSFAEFHRRGQRHAGLGVDSQNSTGATRLYERAGMRVTRESREFERLLRDGRELRPT
jgi:mycothiol synthase